MIAGFPVVVFDKEYHKDLCEHIDMMAKHETISPEDMKLLFVTDSVDELITHIKKYAIKKHAKTITATIPYRMADRERFIVLFGLDCNIFNEFCFIKIV